MPLRCAVPRLLFRRALVCKVGETSRQRSCPGAHLSPVLHALLWRGCAVVHSSPPCRGTTEREEGPGCSQLSKVISWDCKVVLIRVSGLHLLYYKMLKAWAFRTPRRYHLSECQCLLSCGSQVSSVLFCTSSTSAVGKMMHISLPRCVHHPVMVLS